MVMKCVLLSPTQTLMPSCQLYNLLATMMMATTSMVMKCVLLSPTQTLMTICQLYNLLATNLRATMIMATTSILELLLATVMHSLPVCHADRRLWTHLPAMWITPKGQQSGHRHVCEQPELDRLC